MLLKHTLRTLVLDKLE